VPSRVIALPGTIFLVPGKNLDGAWRQQVRDHPHLPASPQALDSDLSAMNAQSGVPARMEPRRNGGRDPSLLVYGRTYVLRLFPTDRRSGYIVASIGPLRLADHHRLATASLQIRAAQWEVKFELRQLPPGSTAFWPELQEEWSACLRETAVQPATCPPDGRPAAFLAAVDRLIDADEKISAEKTDPSETFPYRAVKPTGERRYSRHSVYEFEFAGPPPEAGIFVQVRGEPQQRGQVTRRTGTSAMIRFDQPVGWDHVPPQGQVERTPSSVVYRTQREAVTLLRDGTSCNPSLLSVLVDHRTVAARAAPDEASEPLDADQLRAFRAALGVPDMLLVLGPPGTGKTRVISQIARSVANGSAERKPGRVLITSHTHRAVDNVLTRLPSGLVAIRVGSEGKVTADGQPYLIERQASELRQQVVNRVGRSLAAYADLPHAELWARELGDRNGRLDLATREQEQARELLEATRRAVGGPAQARVEEVVAGQSRIDRAIARSADRVTRFIQRRDHLRARSGWPLVGVVFTILARRAERHLAAEGDNGGDLRTARQRGQAELARAERDLDAATRDHPAVTEARTAAREAARHRATCRDEALSAGRTCRDIVRAIEPFPFRLDQQEPADAERDLAGCHSWLTERLPVLGARARLLAEWLAAASGDTNQFFPELIRYADVVAATCIGAASRPELSDVDFDLAIVDEAGQIGVANALVPLVRARRAVMVGDHQQLPPYLDSDVEAWGEAAGNPMIRDLLTKSLLELLAGKLAAANVVPLTWQRRMPAAIADFISAMFYDGNLHTAVTRKHRDLLFRSPLAFVDTASLPPGERGERSGRDRERWGQPGYTNPAEAELVTELAVYYHRQGREWAVIVPYRAQAENITNALTPLIGDAELARLNVGTVDSFQGGERDVILYGFTRSNPGGRVGFLDELRRANVAFTRARYQLVMAGDLGTLINASDQRFRDLARHLHDYVAANGDLRQYREVRAQLARLDSGEGQA
jgi:AAA domain